MNDDLDEYAQALNDGFRAAAWVAVAVAVGLALILAAVLWPK